MKFVRNKIIAARFLASNSEGIVVPGFFVEEALFHGKSYVGNARCTPISQRRSTNFELISGNGVNIQGSLKKWNFCFVL
jgi:hypothetical protein